jgi:hypothetical protein
MKKLAESMKASAERHVPEYAPMAYDSTITPASLARKTSGLSYYGLQDFLYEILENASQRQKKAGSPTSQNKADAEIVVKPNDVLQSIDKRKPYAALARKVIYYSALGLAFCATLYGFKALYSSCKSLAPK